MITIKVGQVLGLDGFDLGYLSKKSRDDVFHIIREYVKVYHPDFVMTGYAYYHLDRELFIEGYYLDQLISINFFLPLSEIDIDEDDIVNLTPESYDKIEEVLTQELPGFRVKWWLYDYLNDRLKVYCLVLAREIEEVSNDLSRA